MQTLVSKLFPFFESLNYEECRLVHKAVSYLVLFDNLKLYDEMLYLITDRKRIHKPLKYLLTDTYLLKSIWRSCIRVYKEGISVAESASKDSLDPSDLYFCLEGLPNRDLVTFIRYATTEDIFLNPLSDADMSMLVKRLYTFCSKIAYRKLRFLCNSDGSILLEDIKGELIIKALKIIRCYEHLSKDGKHDLVRIENYVKQGISNHVTNLINYYTSKKRARLVSFNVNCGICSACVNSEGSCSEILSDYLINTYSMNNTELYYNLIDDTHKSLESETVFLDLSRKIGFLVEPRVSKFLDIVTDNYSIEFASWLHSKDINIEDVTDYRKLHNLALDFLCLDKNQTRKVLHNAYIKLGSTNV